LWFVANFNDFCGATFFPARSFLLDFFAMIGVPPKTPIRLPQKASDGRALISQAKFVVVCS
jgi:hypothetical protein